MTNLVVNPSFEHVIGNNFANWNEVGQVINNTTYPHSGLHAAQIDSVSVSSLASIKQRVNNLVIGKKYVVSFYYSGNPLNLSPLALNMSFIGLNDAGMTGASLNVNLPTYTKYTGVPFIAKDTSGFIYFVNLSPTSSVLLDDVSIVETV